MIDERARRVVGRRAQLAGARVDRGHVGGLAARDVRDRRRSAGLATLARDARGELAMRAVRPAPQLGATLTSRCAAVDALDHPSARVVRTACIHVLDALCSDAGAARRLDAGELAVRATRFGQRHDERAPGKQRDQSEAGRTPRASGPSRERSRSTFRWGWMGRWRGRDELQDRGHRFARESLHVDRPEVDRCRAVPSREVPGGLAFRSRPGRVWCRGGCASAGARLHRGARGSAARARRGPDVFGR